MLVWFGCWLPSAPLKLLGRFALLASHFSESLPALYFQLSCLSLQLQLQLSHIWGESRVSVSFLSSARGSSPLAFSGCGMGWLPCLSCPRSLKVGEELLKSYWIACLLSISYCVVLLIPQTCILYMLSLYSFLSSIPPLELGYSVSSGGALQKCI